MTKVIEGIIKNLKEKDLTLSKPFATEIWNHLKSDGYELEKDNELFHEETELLYQFNEVGYQIRIACAIWPEGISIPCGEFKTMAED